MKQNTQNQFNPEQEAVLQYVPDFQSTTFTVTGLGETLLPLAEEIKAAEAVPAKHMAVAAVQPAQPVEAPKPAYEDFNTLAPREVLRRKISAKLWDWRNGTDMLGLLNERLSDDRNVAMAQKLGLISSVHCAKHQKVVDKLKQLV